MPGWVSLALKGYPCFSLPTGPSASDPSCSPAWPAVLRIWPWHLLASYWGQTCRRDKEGEERLWREPEDTGD